ncbi:protein of unknown function [Microbacterium sp. Nx66]|nr:protein of unknown function [Microbacterium sp. Nx66]
MKPKSLPTCCQKVITFTSVLVPFVDVCIHLLGGARSAHLAFVQTSIAKGLHPQSARFTPLGFLHAGNPRRDRR